MPDSVDRAGEEQKQVELGERERKVLEVLSADLPQTARVMNAPAITEEIEFGREVTVDPDDLPPQEVYDGTEGCLSGLADLGLVASAEVLGTVAWAATKAGAHAVGARVASDLVEGSWAGYERSGPTLDGPWEFIAVVEAPDDPGRAALSLCVQRWAGGTHRILVVSSAEAREYEVTIETKEVTNAS